MHEKVHCIIVSTALAQQDSGTVFSRAVASSREGLVMCQPDQTLELIFINANSSSVEEDRLEIVPSPAVPFERRFMK
jgi:hypothetical protein